MECPQPTNKPTKDPLKLQKKDVYIPVEIKEENTENSQTVKVSNFKFSITKLERGYYSPVLLNQLGKYLQFIFNSLSIVLSESSIVALGSAGTENKQNFVCFAIK